MVGLTWIWGVPSAAMPLLQISIAQAERWKHSSSKSTQPKYLTIGVSSEETGQVPLECPEHDTKIAVYGLFMVHVDITLCGGTCIIRQSHILEWRHSTFLLRLVITQAARMLYCCSLHCPFPKPRYPSTSPLHLRIAPHYVGQYIGFFLCH